MTVPFAIRASYQTRHYNAGVPQSPDSVFDALDAPPASGVAAEAAVLATSQAVGVIAPNAAALAGRTAHRDRIRDFYDSASVLQPE